MSDYPVRVAQRLILFLVTVLVCSVSVRAYAHPGLDRAIDLARDAEFKRALKAFEQVVEAGDLTRDELVQLLAERALVQQAMGNNKALNRDLAMLASLDPQRDLGPNAPPDLRARWEKAAASSRGPLGMRVETAVVAGGVRVSASLTGGVEGVEFPMVIALRAPGGTWLRTSASEAEYPVPAQGRAEYYVLATGPGGVVVANEGNEEEPEQLTVDLSRLSRSATVDRTGIGAGGKPSRRGLWIGLGAGGVAVVGAIVLVAVLAGRSDRDTQVGTPVVDF